MSIEPTQADHAIAEQANSIWAKASGGPDVAVIAAALSRLASAPASGEAMQHVAYFDEGQFHWMSGIAPRDCELYTKWPGEVEPRTIYVQWAPNGAIRKWDWDKFELAERLKVETAHVSDNPIAWMYAYHPKPPETRPGAVDIKRDRTKLPLAKGWIETPLYAAPSHPAADLVEAAAKVHCDYYGGEGWWDDGFKASEKPKALEAMRAALSRYAGGA